MRGYIGALNFDIREMFFTGNFPGGCMGPGEQKFSLVNGGIWGISELRRSGNVGLYWGETNLQNVGENFRALYWEWRLGGPRRGYKTGGLTFYTGGGDIFATPEGKTFWGFFSFRAWFERSGC